MFWEHVRPIAVLCTQLSDSCFQTEQGLHSSFRCKEIMAIYWASAVFSELCIHSKSTAHGLSRCELSETQMCIWFQQGTKTCVINIRQVWNCSLPSISYCWWSFSSPISHLLQSVTLLACSLDACWTVRLYFSRYCTVRFKIFSLLFVFVFMQLCETCYKSMTVQHYIANCVSWVPRLTLLDVGTNWIYECTLGMDRVCMQGT